MSDLLDDLLQRTSRTFALAIPLLPPTLRSQVGLAYLLLRAADTFEDATWDRASRLDALRTFARFVREPNDPTLPEQAAEWATGAPVEDQGCLDLLRALPELMQGFAKVDPRARQIIARHVLATVEGMADVITHAADDGSVRLDSLEDLRRYCYVVAGLVGELLTALFLLDDRLEASADILNAHAVAFGEALQLVNILKDATDDAEQGRVFLPATVDRAAVFALAREDLEAARRYVCTLQEAGADRGVVAFCGLPVLLARQALDAVEAFGPGARVGRAQVMETLGELHEALDEGRPVL